MPFFYGNPGSFASIVETLSASLTVNNATTNPTLIINQTGSAELMQLTQDTNNDVIYIDNNGTDHGIFINQDGVLANSRYGLYVYTDSAQVNTSFLAYVHQDNSSSSSDVMRVTNDGTGTCLYVNQTTALAASKYGFFVNGGVDLASGSSRLARIYTSTVQTNAPVLFDITDDAATSTSICQKIQKDGTGIAIFIDNNNTGNSIEIDADVNSATAMYGLVMNIANAGAGLEYAFRFDGSEIVAAAVGGSQDQKIRISIAGTDYFIPCHTA